MTWDWSERVTSLIKCWSYRNSFPLVLLSQCLSRNPCYKNFVFSITTTLILYAVKIITLNLTWYQALGTWAVAWAAQTAVQIAAQTAVQTASQTAIQTAAQTAAQIAAQTTVQTEAQTAAQTATTLRKQEIYFSKLAVNNWKRGINCHSNLQLNAFRANKSVFKPWRKKCSGPQERRTG